MRWLLLVVVVATAACRPLGPSPAPPLATSSDVFDFDREPDDEEQFGIDADATRYVGYAPMRVAFGAIALNGVPPVTFEWTFGDDPVTSSGARVTHTFTEPGRVTTTVVGTDASGEESPVHLILRLLPSGEELDSRGTE